MFEKLYTTGEVAKIFVARRHKKRGVVEAVENAIRDC
jgi:predicted acetyltransferase